MSKLDRTVDRLIAAENTAFLADPTAVAAARAEGEVYRQRLEDPQLHDYLQPGLYISAGCALCDQGVEAHRDWPLYTPDGRGGWIRQTSPGPSGKG